MDKKLWRIHIMKHFSEIKRNKLLKYVKTLYCIKEARQKKSIYYMIPSIQNSRKFKLILCEKYRMVLSGWEEKDRWITKVDEKTFKSIRKVVLIAVIVT